MLGVTFWHLNIKEKEEQGSQENTEIQASCEKKEESWQITLWCNTKTDLILRNLFERAAYSSQ